MKALYYGDNLQILRDSIATESVDLIYLDPPLNSKATYNVGLLRESRPQFGAAACPFAATSDYCEISSSQIFLEFDSSEHVFLE